MNSAWGRAANGRTSRDARGLRRTRPPFTHFHVLAPSAESFRTEIMGGPCLVSPRQAVELIEEAVEKPKQLGRDAGHAREEILGLITAD
jgi:hypothetical protein